MEFFLKDSNNGFSYFKQLLLAKIEKRKQQKYACIIFIKLSSFFSKNIKTKKSFISRINILRNVTRVKHFLKDLFYRNL